MFVPFVFRFLISTTFCPSGIDNVHDRYAVAAYEAGNDTVVGHLPREISHWSTCFMDHGGSIEGTVTGARRYCTVAGGREIPCKVTFLGKKRLIAKLKRLIDGLNSSFIYSS